MQKISIQNMEKAINSKFGYYQYFIGKSFLDENALNAYKKANPAKYGGMRDEANFWVGEYNKKLKEVNKKNEIMQVFEKKIEEYYAAERGFIKIINQYFMRNYGKSYSFRRPPCDDVQGTVQWWKGFQNFLVDTFLGESSGEKRNYERDLYEILGSNSLKKAWDSQAQKMFTVVASRHILLQKTQKEKITDEDMEKFFREKIFTEETEQTLFFYLFSEGQSIKTVKKKVNLGIGDPWEEVKKNVKKALREQIDLYNKEVFERTKKLSVDENLVPKRAKDAESYADGALATILLQGGKFAKIAYGGNVAGNFIEETEKLIKTKDLEYLRASSNSIVDTLIDFLYKAAIIYYRDIGLGNDAEKNAKNIKKLFDEKSDLRKVLAEMIVSSTKYESNSEEVNAKTITKSMMQGIIGEFSLAVLGKGKIKSSGAKLQEVSVLKSSGNITKDELAVFQGGGKANPYIKENVSGGQVYTDAVFEALGMKLGFSVKQYSNIRNITLSKNAQMNIFYASAQRYLDLDEIIMISYLIANGNFFFKEYDLKDGLGVKMGKDKINMDVINKLVNMEAALRVMRLEGNIMNEELKDFTRNNFFFINQQIYPASLILSKLTQDLKKDKLNSLASLSILSDETKNGLFVSKPPKDDQDFKDFYIRDGLMGQIILNIADIHLDISKLK